MYEKDVKDPCTLSNEMLLRAVARNPPITEGHPTLAWNEDRPGSTDHQVALWAWLSLPEPPRQGCGGGRWSAPAISPWGLGLCGEVSQKA